MKKVISFILGLLILTSLACSFNFSTADIKSAKISRDAAGAETTTVFSPDDVFYCIVELANALDNTPVKAAWTAVQVADMDPNLPIGEAEQNSAGEAITFDLTNDKLWPAGQYKVDLYLNGKLEQTLEFAVEEAAAAHPPAATPTLQPTATPEAVIEPTATLEPRVVAENSSGDSLVIDEVVEIEPVSAETYETLLFKESPYIHPSGAFTFSLHESFKGIAGDKTSVSFGDDRSVVSAAFTPVEIVFSDKEMELFIEVFLNRFMDAFATDYQVVEQTVQPDGSIYVPVTFTSATLGDGQADFFFEQRDTVVFVLSFVSTTYEEMVPTWQKIIDSYSVNAKAAQAASQPAAAPTPVAPTPTPAPSNIGLAPQGGPLAGLYCQ
jgi:hypothetical protein